MGHMNLSALDYVIVVATLLTSVSVGLYYRFTGGKQKTTEEYLFADRQLRILPVATSLAITYLSGITVLGLIGEFYSNGSQLFIQYFTYIGIAAVIGYVYMPVFFKLQNTSSYEYLELRFGPRMKLIGSLLYTLQQLLYGGIVLYSPALALEASSAIDKRLSILIMGLICAFYSTLGGMKAVVMTDILQAIVALTSVLSVIIFALIKFKGSDYIWEAVKANDRLSFNNFSPDPTERHSIWSVIIGGGTVYMTNFVMNHSYIQRLLTVRTLSDSQKTLWVAISMKLCIFACLWFAALAIFATYKDCDPVANGNITSFDQLLPYYVFDEMKNIPGLKGLFVAGIFSLTLSTLSSSSNGLAAVTIRDYLPHIEKRFRIKSLTGALATKICCMTYGFLFIASAFVAQSFGGLFQGTVSLQGCISGPLVGVFTLGMFTTTVHETAAIIGLLVAMCFTSWKSYGLPRPSVVPLPTSIEGCSNSTNNFTTPLIIASELPAEEHYFYLYKISYLYTALIGMICVIMVAYPLSFLIRCKLPWEKEPKVSIKDEFTAMSLPNPDLFTPLIAKRVLRRNEEILFRKMQEEELLLLKERNIKE